MKKSILKFAGLILAAGLTITGCAQPSGGSTGPKITDYLKVLPAETDGTAGTTATYVEFGEWPQHVLPSTKNPDDFIDRTVTKQMGAFTCYKGQDGEWYVECAENANGEDDAFKYTDGTQAGRNGTTTRYFKVEPIKWRVLTDNYSGKKLLLAENILTANVTYYYNYINTRSVGTDTTIYPNNYKYSQLRAFLNGLSYYDDSNSAVDTYSGKGFLQTAFTSSAQALIGETAVDNSLASTGYTTNSYVCADTTDKIFLLSYKEAFSDGYFDANTNRIRKATDYAKANNAYVFRKDSEYGICVLRSPENNKNFYARSVDSNGNYLFTLVNYPSNGVVPALCVSF